MKRVLFKDQDIRSVLNQKLEKNIFEKVQNICIWTGFGLLMLIFAYSLFLDVPRIFQRIAE